MLAKYIEVYHHFRHLCADVSYSVPIRTASLPPLCQIMSLVLKGGDPYYAMH
jgi:hypothetical protein